MIFQTFLTKNPMFWMYKIEKCIGGVSFTFDLYRTNSRLFANRLFPIDTKYSQLDLGKPRIKMS